MGLIHSFFTLNALRSDFLQEIENPRSAEADRDSTLYAIRFLSYNTRMKTPQGSHPALAKEIGISALYLKREDLHPYGSHKGRSLGAMIDQYVEENITEFAISSSGNAALAAGLHILDVNKTRTDSPLSLSIFIGANIEREKERTLRERLQDSRIEIKKNERPIQALHEAVRQGKKSLRQSTDNKALIGYFDLARELTDIPHLGAVFVPTSSGTTAQGVAEAFQKISPSTQVHIVQTSSCHPLSGEFEQFETDEKSSANAIVDKTAFRKSKLIPLIKRSRGRGWIADNKTIAEAQKILKKKLQIDLNPNGVLSFAGLLLAIEKKYPLSGSVVCIIGGK